MASLMIPGSKASDIRCRTSCFTVGLIGVRGATMAKLTQPRPDGRRVLAPWGCGFGVDDLTGVHPDHRRPRRRVDPGEVTGEDPDVGSPLRRGVHPDYAPTRAHGRAGRRDRQRRLLFRHHDGPPGDGRRDVSGAAHTTAHTVVPSFQIIKTTPGTATVSSFFLMCLSDRGLRLQRWRGQPGSHRRAPGRYRDPGPTTHRHARSRPSGHPAGLPPPAFPSHRRPARATPTPGRHQRGYPNGV